MDTLADRPWIRARAQGTVGSPAWQSSLLVRWTTQAGRDPDASFAFRIGSSRDLAGGCRLRAISHALTGVHVSLRRDFDAGSVPFAITVADGCVIPSLVG